MPDLGFKISDQVRESSRYVVYRASRSKDSKPVMIQTFRSSYPTYRDVNHLKQEFLILSKLSHPNIVKPIGLENFENLPVLVTEDYSGVPLSQVLKKGPLDFVLLLKFAIGITRAVSFLHSKNIIHKNLNPDNILVNSQGEVKILGFEFAMERGRDLSYSNVSEALELRLHYISPEQTGRMNRPTDHRTDLYSIGAICYEMITGRPVFTFQDPVELMHAHLALLPESPAKLRGGLPTTIKNIVLKLLKKNTEDRYQSCSGLLYDLEQCMYQLLSFNLIEDFELATHDHRDQFQISSKIYGRDAELKEMEKIFHRVQAHKAELVLVSGYSGIGKSSFVREFQKQIDLEGGFFIAGKFEQYKKNPPLSSLLLALNDLISQILMRSEEQRDYWRGIAMQALGNSGQLIVEIMPDLELLIGPQPEVPILPIAESKNRFDQVFNSFIRAFAREDHPICIFLDDLQWLDTTTRRWLEATLEDQALKHLMIICAYRENEVSPAHPLMQMLDRLRSQEVITTVIELKPLDQASVEQIVSDSLSIPVLQSTDLAEIVFRKTLGNPFFIRQCLLTLYESGAIYASSATQNWTYNAQNAKRVKISDNVIDLMAELFYRLPDEVQMTLRYASCIGNVFSIEILSGLVDISEAELDMQLKLAEKLCIIENLKSKERSGEWDYGFQHDKIQQAALGMLPEDEKRRVRLAIGKSFISKLEHLDHSDAIYAVTDHFNFAQQLITDRDLQKRIVSLNMSASIRAKHANAYESALAYSKTAMDLVDEYQLDVSKETLRELYLIRAESEHLSGNNETVEEYFNLALSNSENVLDKAKVAIRKIQFFNNIRNFGAAYTTCREITSELGITIPASFSPPALLFQFLKYKSLMGGRDIDQLIDLPEMKDEKLKVAFLVMAAAGQSAFQIRPELCVLLCAIMVNSSLKHGNTAGAFVGYLGFGPVFHSGILGFRTTGYKLGQLVLAMVEKFNDFGGRAEANFVTGYFAIPWRKPAREMEQYWQTAYETALEVGDQFHASCAVSATLQSHFMRGVPFETILETSRGYLDFLKRIHLQEGVLTIAAVVQSIKNLKGMTESKLSFSEGSFDEKKYVEQLAGFSSRHFAHFYYINKMQTLYLWESYQEAYDISLTSDAYLKDSPGMLHTAEHFFYKGLILAALISQASGAKKFQMKRKLNSIVRKFSHYSTHCPSNFQPKYFLLLGEWTRVNGNLTEAQRYFYQALESAESYEYLQIQALANRKLYELIYVLGNRKVAAIHLRDAMYLYDLLGAKGIGNQLRNQLNSSHFSPKEVKFGHRQEDSRKVQRELSTQDLDLSSVMKSSEAISKEIKLKDLLTILMKIIIENAGAQRMVLLLKNEQGLFVQSESSTKSSSPKLFEQMSMKDYSEIAKEVVNFVVKNKENVILDTATQDYRFAKDPYIQREQPKSLLCVPLVKQGEVTGIIYLENNLIEGAFTKERIGLINILSSQMAISLENALLYENMEEMIRLRTEQFNEEKEKSEKLLLNILPPEVAAELKNEGNSKARYFENVSVMFTDIVNFSSISEQLPPEELVDELNYYYCEFDRIVEKYGVEKIKTIGDSYMCAGGLNLYKPFDISNIVLAAFEMDDFIQNQALARENMGRPKVNMRIGIHSGPVIAGIVGIKKFAYDIWGDTVNIASRMETTGQPGKVNISEYTYQLIKDRFKCTPRGKIEVKNKGQVEMYFVERE